MSKEGHSNRKGQEMSDGCHIVPLMADKGHVTPLVTDKGSASCR